jgi:Fe-S cluster biogenesis protein NfuA
MKPQILGAIMQHFMSGEPVLREAGRAAGDGDGAAAAEGEEPVSDADAQLVEQVKELIDTRIHPAVSQSGGDIALHSMTRDGTVNLRLEGTAFSLLSQIGNMLQHYVPEVSRVQDYRDAIAKPGLETETGRAVREILETRINPAVHGHGGHISLIDVRGETVYIRLEGGCQGCGMADVTLKQGVEREIKRAVPAIEKILDVTDHAAGSNPYYQPGKGGASPVA